MATKKIAAKKAVPAKKPETAKPAAKPVPAKKPASKPSSQPAKKPETKPVPAAKPAAKPVPAKKPASKPSSQPAKKPETKPVPAKKPEPAKKPPVKKPVPPKPTGTPKPPVKKPTGTRKPPKQQPITIAVPREPDAVEKPALLTSSPHAYSFAELQTLLEIAGKQTFNLYVPADAEVATTKENDSVTVLNELPKASSDTVIGPASLADLFGGFNPFAQTAAQDEESLIPEKWRSYYKALLEWREKDQKMLDSYNEKLNRQETKEETGEVMALDADGFTNVSSEAFDRDVVIARIGHVRNELNEISAAIERMKKGSYGLDEKTGRPIRAERLKKLPFARRDTVGQREVEKELQNTRPRFKSSTLKEVLLGEDIESHKTPDDEKTPNAPGGLSENL